MYEISVNSVFEGRMLGFLGYFLYDGLWQWNFCHWRFISGRHTKKLIEIEDEKNVKQIKSSRLRSVNTAHCSVLG